MMQLTINYQRAYNWIQMLSPLLLCTSVMSVVQLPMQIIKRKQLFPHVQCQCPYFFASSIFQLPASIYESRRASWLEIEMGSASKLVFIVMLILTMFAICLSLQIRLIATSAFPNTNCKLKKCIKIQPLISFFGYKTQSYYLVQ